MRETYRKVDAGTLFSEAFAAQQIGDWPLLRESFSLEMIVAGTAKDSNKYKAKEMQTGCEVSSRRKMEACIDGGSIILIVVNHFSVREEVVIAHPSIVDSLSGIVRQHLISLSRHKMTEDKRQDKIHDLYGFMTGKEFHQRISGIVESAVNLEGLTDREIRAHERLWAQRKKLHERLVRQTALLYGEISGIVGTLPPVPQLELPEGLRALENGIDELQEGEDITL
jgi:hypothetical protein